MPLGLGPPKSGLISLFLDDLVNFDDLEMMEPTLDLEMTWTYKPTCDGKVTLINNIGAPGNVLNVTYDANLKTMMNEDGLFALNSKKG